MKEKLVKNELLYEINNSSKDLKTENVDEGKQECFMKIKLSSFNKETLTRSIEINRN